MTYSKFLKAIYLELNEDEVNELNYEIGLLVSSYKEKTSVSSDHLDVSDSYMLVHPWSFIGTKDSAIDNIAEFIKKIGRKSFSNMLLFPVLQNDDSNIISVTDHYNIDKRQGNWDNIANLSKVTKIVPKIPINSVSVDSIWVNKFINCDPEFEDFFIWKSEKIDYSKVIREAKTKEIFIDIKRSNGQSVKLMSCTKLQVELNFANPKVLLKIIDVILNMTTKGNSGLTLDRLNYLIKDSNPVIFSDSQTHSVLELIREVVANIKPYFAIMVSNNVPFKENMSYLWSGMEANSVYNYALAPTAIYSINKNDPSFMANLIKQMDLFNGSKITSLNFLEVSRGISLIGSSDILNEEEQKELITILENKGGNILRTFDGKDDVEFFAQLNLFNALTSKYEDEDVQIRKYLLCIALTFVLNGFPMIYYPNWLKASSANGIRKDLNEWPIYEIEELKQNLKNSKDIDTKIFKGINKLLKVRKENVPLHGFMARNVVNVQKERGILIVKANGQEEEIFIILNFSKSNQVLNMDHIVGIDLLTKKLINREVKLKSYGMAFVKTK